ncbi:hypothetical protein TEA_016001 [Camellia sinensis var. sinensis]|uniref:Cysteine-rich receptor-like protein kinase 10 n=2 Tax=Camellia sinensis TaxID=4442 RepID=A0A4S4DQK0_CAMSN|nr:hypothetical protein TEA_016001 [Camellia sinensis var. sinensis]
MKSLITIMPSLNTSRVFLFRGLLCFLSLSIQVSSVPFGYDCAATITYTPNSTYKSNLDILLSVLSSNATFTNDFYNFTVGQDSSNDVVHGLFLCRGDVSANDCQNCVSTASKELVQLCPKQKTAIAYYDNCLLRYSNQYIFSVLDQSSPHEMHNPINITNNLGRFKQVLSNIMDDVVTRAVKDQSGKKFATKTANVTAVDELYGLAQCTPDISSKDCNTCLSDAISNLPICCEGKQGGRYLFPSCNVRYELYPFYNNATAPPPPPPVLPPPPSPGRARNTGKGGISSQVLIAIIVSIVVFVLLFIIGLCFLISKAKKKYDALQEDTIGNEIATVQSLQYDLITIQAATNNFSEENKIGKGGFGDVYKGTLPNGQDIAVKRLSQNSGQGAEEFKNEVVLVAKLQHRNLVRLLGFCLEGEEKILIYEFVANKSLDYFLFDPKKQKELDWPIRYQIVRGIARGILYLHQDSRLRVIHRDLKTSNILLDEEMNAKVSDFGLARIFGVNQTQANTDRVIGTYGYMSPEYAVHGHFSVKSDVFSFGVLVLEIISGKKNSEFYHSDYADDLLSYAWKLWKDERPLEMMDPTLEGSYSRNEVTRCIHIGLLCVQEDPNTRPSMATVFLMLNSYSVTLSFPQKPAFFARYSIGTPTQKRLESSVNEVSITELYPR